MLGVGQWLGGGQAPAASLPVNVFPFDLELRPRPGALSTPFISSFLIPSQKLVFSFAKLPTIKPAVANLGARHIYYFKASRSRRSATYGVSRVVIFNNDTFPRSFLAGGVVVCM